MRAQLRIAACIAIVASATDASAQHFSKPAAIDPSITERIGEPVFMLPHPTTSFGSVYSDGWLYVMGGYAGRPHDYYHEAQSKAFYRVNLLDTSHIEHLGDTQGLQACPLESWNGMIIRTGGLVARNMQGEPQQLESLRTVEAFDLRTKQWTSLPDLPVGRSSHDTAVVGSTLYVVGGWTLDSSADERVWSESVLALDLEDQSAGWRQINAPFSRRALASVVVGESIVVLGGMTSAGQLTNRVDVYDTVSGEWTSGPEFPGTSFGMAADVTEGRVVASGSDGTIYGWSPDSDSAWDNLGVLTFPRFFHQVAADTAGDIYFFGGISRGMRPVHAERINLGGRPAPGEVVAHWTLPSPSVAKNRQGIFMEDGWLYMFGGNNSTGQHDFQPENFLSEGYRLSLSGLRWRKIEPLPEHRQTIKTALTADGEHALAIGGFGHDGEVARTFAHGFMYDFADRAWSKLGVVMPTPRSQYGLVRHGETYWAFGGLDYDSRRSEGDQFRHLTTVLSGKLEDGKLELTESSSATLPGPRRAFGGALLDDTYYLVGGMKENFQTVGDSFAFDFSTEAFREIPSPSRQRLSPTLVELGGLLYLVGGSSPKEGGGFEPNASIEVFDPSTNQWSMFLDEIPVSPRHLRAMAFRGRLLLSTTHTDESNRIELLLIETGEMRSGDSSETRADGSETKYQ
ncbi:MAG: kelch repeat-containing protein [Planctomycetota bacterium]